MLILSLYDELELDKISKSSRLFYDGRLSEDVSDVIDVFLNRKLLEVDEFIEQVVKQNYKF